MATPHEPVTAAASAEEDGFRLAEEHRGARTVVLSPRGELDIATAPELRDRLHALIEAGASRLILDLRAVSFIDSVALAAILSARRQLGGDGRLAVVIDPESYTRLVFEIAGLPRSLDLFETRDEALARTAA